MSPSNIKRRFNMILEIIAFIVGSALGGAGGYYFKKDNVGTEITNEITKLKADIAELESKFESKEKEVESDTKSDVSTVDSQVSTLTSTSVPLVPAS